MQLQAHCSALLVSELAGVQWLTSLYFSSVAHTVLFESYSHTFRSILPAHRAYRVACSGYHMPMHVMMHVAIACSGAQHAG